MTCAMWILLAVSISRLCALAMWHVLGWRFEVRRVKSIPIGVPRQDVRSAPGLRGWCGGGAFPADFKACRSPVERELVDEGVVG